MNVFTKSNGMLSFSIQINPLIFPETKPELKQILLKKIINYYNRSFKSKNYSIYRQPFNISFNIQQRNIDI